MNIDDYLNNLRGELDSKLKDFSLGEQQDASTAEDSVFCPECGTKNPAGANFCCNCGTTLVQDYDEELYDSEEDETCDCDKAESCDSEAQYGILYTDVQRLANKYGCSTDDVCAILDDFCDKAAEYNMYWEILDASDNPDYFNSDDFWLEHNELISDYFEQSSIEYGMKTPLFIIGGNDVIPIPMVEDVFGTSRTGRIPCDMAYCFQGNFFSDIWEYGDHTITEASVRNTVSRLPLEDGKMETNLEDDLGAYFDLCAEYYEEGIPVERVMMTANASWLPASKTMSEHLPLLHSNDTPNLVKHGMYVSPPVMADNEETNEPLIETLENDKTGMLLFNLHGASNPGMSGFYSDYGKTFDISMLSGTNARVFNTVACFGARYFGYERDYSMLLSAFYNEYFLLYAGSLIPVPMMELNVPEGVEVHEGSGSEHLMPIYCMEQFTGAPMGEAMMRAKLNYFNVFRHMERDDFSMATMMMFSLYGNPMLRMVRNEEVLRRAEEEHVLPKLPQKGVAPVRKKETQCIMLKEGGSSSLLDQVRGLVDDNISAIHKELQKHLYDELGLEPRWLTRIDRFAIPNGDGSYEEGYSYAYEDKSKAFDNMSWVEVDYDGNIKRVFKSK